MTTPAHSPSLRILATLTSLVLVSPGAVRAAEWNFLGETRRIGAGITPGIASDSNGAVHVVYMHEGEIYHRQAAAGLNFGPVGSLPLPEGKANYNSPHVVCDAKGVVHVAFERDFTRASRKAWYTNRQNLEWKAPLLAIERTEQERRVNYPRLTVGNGVAWLSAFTGGSSTIVKLTELDTAPRVSGRIDTTLWVAHAFPCESEILVVGRAGASGHKLERYDARLSRIGEPLLLSRGSPTKTFEPTAAIIDPKGVIHIVGATAQPVQRLWYTTDRRAAAGEAVILGPELGEHIAEFTYPVMLIDRRGRLYASYRDHTTGEARVTVYDDATSRFAEPITVAPSTTRRLRWNPHLAAAPDGGVYVAWDDNGQVLIRTVGATAHAGDVKRAQ